MKTELNETMPFLFELNNICYTYPEGSNTALGGISFNVAAGESVAILGANACGKSTLLQLLDGLLFAQTGSIAAFGDELSSARFENHTFNQSFRCRVGLVFQEAETQLFCPTVRDEIAFGPLQLGLAQEEVKARVTEMLMLCNMAGKENRAPYLLSGGEKRRVALASVLAIDPEVLLLDEPTGGLDPRAQTWLIELLASLRTAGKTIITATHDLSIVPEIADRVLVMGEDHRLWAQGMPDEILSNLDLLLEVNLIHEHTHAHGTLRHRHPHAHFTPHKH
jgi:cobalt/nickel transport system ATP-binding protein